MTSRLVVDSDATPVPMGMHDVIEIVAKEKFDFDLLLPYIDEYATVILRHPTLELVKYLAIRGFGPPVKCKDKTHSVQMMRPCAVDILTQLHFLDVYLLERIFIKTDLGWFTEEDAALSFLAHYGPSVPGNMEKLLQAGVRWNILRKSEARWSPNDWVEWALEDAMVDSQARKAGFE